jgi:hypothetical protein
MRSRGMATKTVRPAPKRRAKVGEGSGNGGQVLAGKQRERPAARQHTSFRRVAVFVPLSAPDAS